MINIDPRLQGIADDGSSEGAVKAKLVRGDLSVQPFRAGSFLSESSVGSSALNTTLTNPYRLGGALFQSVAFNAAGSGTRVFLPFRGKVFGLVSAYGSSATTALPISIVIDGVAYAADLNDNKQLGLQSISTLNHQGMPIFLKEDLPEGKHIAEIVMTMLSSGTISCSHFGYVVERRAGYPDSTPTVVPTITAAPSTLTASQANIYTSGSTGNMRYIKEIWYQNNDVATRIVTIQFNAVTIKQITLAAGASEKIVFSDGIFLDSQWKHAADVTSVVSFLLLGGN